MALDILKQVMEEKLSDTNVEIGVVRADDCQFRIYNQDELRAVIERLD